MVERKTLAYSNPLRLLFGWILTDHARAAGVKQEKKPRPKEEAAFAPETNHAVLIEHYKQLGRGPL